MYTFRMIFFLMTVMFGTINANAQSDKQITNKNKLVTLNEKGRSLYDVMTRYSAQTGTSFYFIPGAEERSSPVYVECKDIPPDMALKQIFSAQTGVKYILQPGGQIEICVKTADVPLYDSPPLSIPILHGIVTDKHYLPLTGAVVTCLYNRRISTVTDESGRYRLLRMPLQGNLLVNCPGYEPKVIKYNTDQAPPAHLELRTRQLNTTVVKPEYHYLISTIPDRKARDFITGNELEGQLVNDLGHALAGRVSGLQITQLSGVPGSGTRTFVRGYNSMPDGIGPLYVLDGVIMNTTSLSQTANAAGRISPLSSLDLLSISHIEILKDAEAIARYGSRGTNGVILITTKRGQAGKPRTQFDYSNGIAISGRKVKLMNTMQYIQMRREAMQNDGVGPGSTDYDMNGTWDTIRYTDWQESLIGNTARQEEVRLSLSQGSDQTQYLISGKLKNQTTVYPEDFNNRQITSHASITHQSRDQRLKCTFSNFYGTNSYHLPVVDLASLIFSSPNSPPVKTAEGKLNWENNTYNNPYAVVSQYTFIKEKSLVSSIYLQQALTSKVYMQVLLGHAFNRLDDMSALPFVSLLPGSSNPEDQRSMSAGSNQSRTWVVEPELVYSSSKRLHSWEMAAGFTMQRTVRRGQLFSGRGFISDEQMRDINNARHVSFSATKEDYQYASLAGRASYSYAGRYVLTGTMRRDGSSRISSNGRYRLFWAAGATWVFSEERLLGTPEWLIKGKLHVGLANTGNDRIPYDVPVSTAYQTGYGYMGTLGLTPGNNAVAALQWQINKKSELGIELELPASVTVKMIYYRNKTKNQLAGRTLPATTGYETMTANMKALILNTGLEVDARKALSQTVESNNLRYDLFWNLTVPRNKLVSFPDLEASSFGELYKVGYPLNVRMVNKSTGVDSQTGIYTFEQSDAPGTSSRLKKEPVVIGPVFYTGLGLGITFGSVRLDVHCQYVHQQGMRMPPVSMAGQFIQRGSNQLQERADRWRKSGDRTPYQKYSSIGDHAKAANTEFQTSDGMIQDASYARVRNISLLWALPVSWCERVSVKSAGAHLNMQNPLTFTGYTGTDPETQASGNHSVVPPLTVISTGVRIVF
ncbi:SusC/RagA family TonB-linked outer membrane protein [Chitinophaga rhizophila]|uniref:SusC/RagA family TonB-linked outer membrane protein n=1 Tax=Chitinophaga rhizophila TaxID=2866212 RepID=A0ABS7G600_9BACT|nr:SusC/RagA family TonB-linked outer membrane protein [Chitinophaga rhizophila]MBW8683081.1 SusC/RagA family TonB-linked outer membrane protein [Chitinophaga rhizophila]